MPSSAEPAAPAGSAAAPAAPAAPGSAGEPERAVVLVGFASFLLLGWASLLLPSLIRDVQRTFGQDDAGMGGAYLLGSLLYLAGTASTGLLAGRLPRRILLAAGPGLLAVGLVLAGTTGSWGVFLLGYAAMGVGNGIVDAGVNALFMDLYAGRAGMLNRLHSFFALGALAAPLAVGAVAVAGIAWQAVLLGTAAAAIPIALVLGTRTLPPTHRDAPSADPGSGAAPGPARRSRAWPRVPLPLVALAAAIGAYVAAELGVSAWLVRYLAEAPLQVATLALSLYWAAIGLGRLAASYVADRVGAVRLAVASSVLFGAAIAAALVAPSLPVAIACFTLAGFAAAPVFPLVMAIGGRLYPGRVSTVSSVLASAAIAGSVVYPPLMGIVSETAGLGAGMTGAAVFAIACGGSVLLAVRLAARRPTEA